MQKLRWKIAQAAEIRWWQNYLKGKSESEYLAWKLNYWQEFMQKIGVQPAPGEEILDMGCGPAGVFIALPDNAVTAVDPLLDDYAAKLPHFSPGRYPHTRFVTTPFEEFTTDKKFDKIFCLNAVNHVADLALCFDKLAEMTAPDGTLVVSIDAHNYGFFKRLFRLLPGDILHPHQYDLQEYETMLTDRGLKIERRELIKSEFFFDYYALVCRREVRGGASRC